MVTLAIASIFSTHMHGNVIEPGRGLKRGILVLERASIVQAAKRLDEAETSRRQIRLLSLDHPDITIDDAYAIQGEWVAAKIGRGRKLKGHKIGLTSRAMQLSSQISEPDYGALLDDMFFNEGTDIPIGRFIEPRVEVELAFILGKPLSGPNCTIFDVMRATDCVTPAVEIIDARIHRIDPELKKPRRVMDTISDNAANAGIVLGGRPIKPDQFDLRWVSALCYQNGVIEEFRGRGRSPQSSRAWHCMARQQAFTFRCGSGARPGGTGGFVYAAGIRQCEGYVSRRLQHPRLNCVSVCVRPGP